MGHRPRQPRSATQRPQDKTQLTRDLTLRPRCTTQPPKSKGKVRTRLWSKPTSGGGFCKSNLNSSQVRQALLPHPKQNKPLQPPAPKHRACKQGERSAIVDPTIAASPRSQSDKRKSLDRKHQQRASLEPPCESRANQPRLCAGSCHALRLAHGQRTCACASRALV